MNLNELAMLMGKTREEIEDKLKESDVIELNLSEKTKPEPKEGGGIKIVD